MRIKQFLFVFFLTLPYFFLFCEGIFNPKDDESFITKNGFHIRKGFMDPLREYKFENTPIDVKFVPSFPLESIQQEIPPEVLNVIDFEYWIFTSVDDAELSMVERLDMSTLALKNIIDFPLAEGKIGHNCWYQLDQVGIVTFIRNNVLMMVWFNGNGAYDPKMIESVSRKMDSILVETGNGSKNNIPAPTINSVKITSELPENWEQPVELTIDAQDPNNLKLRYRKYASGFGNISETGVLTVYPFKPVDESDDPQKARVKIWVWNENYIITSVIKIIPFR